MHVYLNGWQRDHGRKTIVHEDLEECTVTEKSYVTHSFGKGAIRVENDDEGNFVSLVYSRGLKLTANGDYLFQLKLMPRDIVMMAFFCLKEISMTNFSKVFGAMSVRKDEIEAARRTLRLGYSTKGSA